MESVYVRVAVNIIKYETRQMYTSDVAAERQRRRYQKLAAPVSSYFRSAAKQANC